MSTKKKTTKGTTGTKQKTDDQPAKPAQKAPPPAVDLLTLNPDALADRLEDKFGDRSKFDRQRRKVLEAKKLYEVELLTLEKMGAQLRKAVAALEAAELETGEPWDDALKRVAGRVKLSRSRWEGGKPTGAKPWGYLRTHGATDAQILTNLRNVDTNWEAIAPWSTGRGGNWWCETDEFAYYDDDLERKVTLVSGQAKMLAAVRRVFSIGEPVKAGGGEPRKGAKKSAGTKVATKPAAKAKKQRDGRTVEARASAARKKKKAAAAAKPQAKKTPPTAAATKPAAASKKVVVTNGGAVPAAGASPRGQADELVATLRSIGGPATAAVVAGRLNLSIDAARGRLERAVKAKLLAKSGGQYSAKADLDPPTNLDELQKKWDVHDAAVDAKFAASDPLAKHNAVIGTTTPDDLRALDEETHAALRELGPSRPGTIAAELHIDVKQATAQLERLFLQGLAAKPGDGVYRACGSIANLDPLPAGGKDADGVGFELGEDDDDEKVSMAEHRRRNRVKANPRRNTPAFTKAK